MTDTPKRMLIEILIPDLRDIVTDSRAGNESWRSLATRINRQLPAGANVTHESLRTWYKGTNPDE